MRQRSLRTLITLASGALLIGCQALPIVPHGSGPAPAAARSVYPRVEGQVAFPGDRQIAATTGEIVSRATVSIIDAAGQTVAATVTDTAGNFTLDVNGSFTPITGAYYTVEAIKGLASNTAASNAVRMRTLLQWTGTAWNSCTGGTTITLNPTTTAVSIIKARLSAVGYPETMGVVTGNSVTSGNATLNANWQAVRDLVNDLLWRDLDPVARIGLNGTVFAVLPDRSYVVAANLSNGTFSSTSLMLDGSIQLTGSLPRPKIASEISFASGLTNSGLVISDGTYLYIRQWTAAAPYVKFGSGFGSTTQGVNVGTYANANEAAMSAGYYGGYIYQARYDGSYTNTNLQRLNVTSGVVDTLGLNTPLIFRYTGVTDHTVSTDKHIHLCTDGRYFYNLAFGINGTSNNGFTVRVYDPANGFAFVRQIILDGANTTLANSSYYTDGVFADGVYIYPFEWSGELGQARIRRYRLSDGQLEAETTVGQVSYTGGTNDDPISGSYDYVNNKFWFGNYLTGTIHRTAGRVFASTGTWTSAPLDMGSAAPLFGRLSFNAVAVNGQTLRLQMRSANDQHALSTATWYGPTGTGDYYTTSGTSANPVHNRQRWVQFRATLTPDTTAMLTNSGPLQGGGTGASAAPNTTPRLYGVNLEVTP